jgi:ribosome-binding protein aMBF1 (putative translation factor)
MPGEKNPNAKITAEIVSAVRKVREQEGLSYSKLGSRFGIDKKHAHEIVTRLAWKHVP